MRITRKLAVMLLITFVCCLGVFAYEQGFDECVVEGEWITSISADNFNSIATNKKTWLGYTSEWLDTTPSSFALIDANDDELLDFVLDNLMGYIETWNYVEDNDVYAHLIANNVYEDSGIIVDGWLVVSHYSAKTDNWTFYVYSFSM